VPNVDSSLVKFIRHAEPGDEELRKKTFEIIDQSFAKRRKMLRAALNGLVNESEIESAGIDPRVRGEVLELSEFIKIAKILK
jgi:16S rRNA (adenine1518-N6/adenine1519-N6)-dimethyltransferase